MSRCENCGAPKHGQACEYCGTRFDDKDSCADWVELKSWDGEVVYRYCVSGGETA